MPEHPDQPRPLPTRITPCSIVNAITEVRFQTDQSPTVVPGLIYSAVRDRFPKQAELGEAQIPDAARAKMPELRYSPTVVMHGEQLSLHVGPRAFFLSMRDSADYPGWSAYREMLIWLLKQIRPLKMISAPERLGLRYSDFFGQPLHECLQVDLLIGGKSEIGQPLQVTSHLTRHDHVCRVQISSPAILESKKGAKQGCLLDVDMGFTVDAQLFWEQAVPRFDQAHQVQKEMFFRELLNPAFLATLNPEY
jgi:uncharacterized protein (TIGR04255 family)